MDGVPGKRIFGVETEFGTLVEPDSGLTPELAVEAIKDTIFYDLRLGALDLHARDDVFEPARSGGFLMNGARLYVDAVGSHLEYATAECQKLKDLVANDRAGHRLISRAIRHLGWDDQVSVYNNSIDHFGGHTFGCHENYLVRADENLFSEQINYLYPFLATRQIFAGVGRVGGHVLVADAPQLTQSEVDANPIDYIWVGRIYGVIPDDTVEYQLSQRADHILKTVASRVRFNRALVNPKWEHYYSYDGTTRLHLLFGEANPNPYAYALKVGTTLLMLDLLEDGLLDSKWNLAHPIYALREVSRDASHKWLVPLESGDWMSAIDLHREYLKLAGRYAGASDDVDWTLREWESVLDQLEKDPSKLADRLDWVSKREIVNQYREANGMGWDDDSLHSIDLEYHNIDPKKSLFGAWQEMGNAVDYIRESEIQNATAEAPQNTRAAARAALVEQAIKGKLGSYMFDWSGVSLDRLRYIDLSDPFDPTIPVLSEN